MNPCVDPSTNWASISIISSNETLRLTNFSRGHGIKQSEFEQTHLQSMRNQTKQNEQIHVHMHQPIEHQLLS